MKVAIEGCCHGELDNIYETIGEIETKTKTKIDLLLICGDFQAVRTQADLAGMACPQKYRDMATFYKYYSGEKVAPVLTIFIGGNHEASNHLQELFYGGWVAPNIYYLGSAGVVNVNGLRIGGVSGIYKSNHYKLGHFEMPPYDAGAMRSVYHVREFEIWKMKQLSGHIDVMLSHDWPRGVYNHGDSRSLLRKKSFLQQEIQSNSLGSVPNEELLDTLQPSYWFSAHLHVKFPAVVDHKKKRNDRSPVTKFLSLDKCLPQRDFLQIVDFPNIPPSSSEGPSSVAPPKKESPVISYDIEWLAITKLAHEYFSNDYKAKQLPTNLDPMEVSSTCDEIEEWESLCIPENFERTEEIYDPQRKDKQIQVPLKENPQTTALLTKLKLENNLFPPKSERQSAPAASGNFSVPATPIQHSTRRLSVTSTPSALPQIQSLPTTPINVSYQAAGVCDYSNAEEIDLDEE